MEFEGIESDFLKLLLLSDPSVGEIYDFEKVSLSTLYLFEKSAQHSFQTSFMGTLDKKAESILAEGGLAEENMPAVPVPSAPDKKKTREPIFKMEETRLYGKLRKFPQKVWQLFQGELLLQCYKEANFQEYLQAQEESKIFQRFFDTLVELEEAGVLKSPGKLLWGGRTEIVNEKNLDVLQGKTTNRILTTIQIQCRLDTVFEIEYRGVSKVNILEGEEKVGAIDLKSETSREEAQIKDSRLNEYLLPFTNKIISNEYPGLENVQLRGENLKLAKTGQDREFTTYELSRA